MASFWDFISGVFDTASDAVSDFTSGGGDRPRPPKPPSPAPVSVQSVNKRITAFSPEMMDFGSSVVAWATAGSSMTDRQAAEFGGAMSEATNYVLTSDAFAGRPGAFSILRDRISRMPHGLARTYAEDLLQELQKLSPDNQSAAFAVLFGARQTNPRDDIFGGFFGRDEGVITGEGEIELYSTRAAVDKMAALKYLFPQLKIHIGEEEYEGQRNEISSTLLEDNVTDLVYSNPFTRVVADTFLDSPSVARTSQNIEALKEGEISSGIFFKRFFVEGLGVQGDIGLGLAQNVVSASGGQEVVEKTRSFWETNTYIQDWERGVFIMAAAGLDRSDPDFEENVENRIFGLSIFGIVAGEAVSLVGQAAKRAFMSAAPKAVTKEILAQSLPRARTGVLGTIAESYRTPQRALLTGINKFAIKFARDPEEFFAKGLQGRQGRKLLDVLAEAKTRHPGDIDGQSAFVRESYRAIDVPDRFVRALLRPGTREGAKRVFIETLTNRKHGSQVLNSTRNSLKAVQNRIRVGNVTEAEMTLLRHEERALRWKLETTFDETPMLQYPSQSVIRASVRAPVTRFQKFFYNRIMRGEGDFERTRLLDPAKLVDENPKNPRLFVPGRADNPTDWLDKNTHTMSTALRRLGVSPQTAQKAIGRLNAARSEKSFFQILEHEIFGEGGLVDRTLKPSTNPDVRERILSLHDTPVEYRTRSVIQEFVEDPIHFTRERLNRHVLGEETEPGVTRPLPSRPSEDLDSVRLPDVDMMIEADSAIRRAIYQIEKYGGRGGKAATMAAWHLPIMMARVATGILKPAVMLVRLPAMATRIQIEQGLRAQAFGFRPWVGLPEGLSLLPGGIPIPGTNHRMLAGLFGPDGWRLLDPDPDYKGLSKAIDNADAGMFLDEAFDRGRVERVPEGTSDLRLGRRPIKIQHTEAGRSDLEVTFNDKLDGALARFLLSEDEGGTGALDSALEWLVADDWARRYMTGQTPVLQRSTLHTPQRTTVAPAEISIDLSFQELDRFGVPGDDYWYHIGDSRDAPSVLESTLMPSPPGSRTNIFERTWEDESVENRLFLGDSPAEAAAAAGGNEVGSVVSRRGLVLYRIRKDSVTTEVMHGVNPRTGRAFDDTFTRDTPDAGEVDFVGPDNGWHKIVDPDDPVAVEQTTRLWLENRFKFLQQQTRGDPDMLEALTTGSLRVRRGVGVDTSVDPTGKPVEIDYNNSLSDLDNLNTEIKRRVASGHQLGPSKQRAELAALQEARLAAIRRLRRIEREYPNVVSGPDKIKFADKKKFRAELKRRWQENPDAIPSILHVEKKRSSNHHDGGPIDDSQALGAGISAAMYRKMRVLTYIDKKGTRGSLFKQAESRYRKQLRLWGYTDDEAAAIAYSKAGALTRDLMYDLNARTSVQRALKDVFWFLPAFQEVLYTWLVKIPSQSFWPLGVAGLAAKAALIKHGLRATGLLQKSEKNEDILVLPGWTAGAVEFLARATGADIKVPPVVFGKLSGLNMVTTGVVPGLSTPANFVVGQAALRLGGVFKEISNLFQPYGPETTLLPAPITHLFEALVGEAPPWEPLGSDYIKAQWDRSSDIGIQYAYSNLKSQGIAPPRPEDYGTYDKETEVWSVSSEQEAAYKAASTRYTTRLMTEGQEYARGIALMRLLGSTVAPMSLYTTTKEEQQWKKFWAEVVVPEGFGTTGFSDSQRELIDAYVSDHPNSLAFTVFYNGYGLQERNLPFAESLDDSFYDDYLTGERETLSAHDYSSKLMATEARRFYQARQDTTLRRISPTLDPWELLTQGYERNDAILDNRESYERWLALNPEAEALLLQQSARWHTAENVPVRSYEAERLSQTILNLKLLAPSLSGETTVRPVYLRQVQADLAALYSEKGEFGKPNTPTEKAMAWWYENVLNPYFEAVSPLYQKAEDRQNRGLNASEVYNRIRQLSNGRPLNYRGVEVPSVEEVFFGNKNPEERETTRLSWASRPITWLSDFQRETAGFNVNEKTADFLESVSKYDEEFWARVNRQDTGFTNTKEYDALVARRRRDLTAEARDTGPQALRMFRLSETQPYARLNYVGFGDDNERWRATTEKVHDLVSSIENEGLSPKGFSGFAVERKAALYREIERIRSYDSGFDNLMVEASHAFPMPGGGWREGAVLYEAVFFGNFNDRYIPHEIAIIGA